MKKLEEKPNEKFMLFRTFCCKICNGSSTVLRKYANELEKGIETQEIYCLDCEKTFIIQETSEESITAEQIFEKQITEAQNNIDKLYS